MSAPPKGRVTRLPLPGVPLRAGPVPLPAEATHYLCQVLRLGEGAEIAVFDGEGLQASGPLRLSGGAAHVELRSDGAPGVGHGPVSLVYALPKGDKLDTVARQITELGVARLILLSAQRSVVRLSGARAAQRVDRLSRITAEAARQSGRAHQPTVEGPLSLTEALQATAHSPTRIVLDPHAIHPLHQIEPSAHWSLFVGPEGGFSPDELDEMRAAGVRSARLGPSVLRTETAAPVACALALAQLGWW